MRALIVDDSRFVRGFLRNLLEDKGMECVEAGDGQAGLDELHGKVNFDLALMDWNMPVMNGPGDAEEAARRGIQRYESDDGDDRGRKRLHSARAGRRGR